MLMVEFSEMIPVAEMLAMVGLMLLLLHLLVGVISGS